MLGCEIIEAAEEGDDMRWTHEYAARIIREHGVSIGDYYAEGDEFGCPTRLLSDLSAANVLLWLGY